MTSGTIRWTAVGIEDCATQEENRLRWDRTQHYLQCRDVWQMRRTMDPRDRHESTGPPSASDSGGRPDESDQGLTLEYERVPAEEAFELLGHETRLRILQELIEAQGGPITFSELRERVGMRDPSQFNYHLKKLDGPFVRKLDDGYAVRHAGVRVIRSIVTGSFTTQPRIDPFETGGACVACGESLLAYYDYGLLFVECSECERHHSMGIFPPGALTGRTREQALAAYGQWQRRYLALVVEGVCGMCGGRMIRASGNAEDLPIKLHAVEPDDFLVYAYNVRYDCDGCDVWSVVSPGCYLLDDPTVVDFYHEHGIDLRRVPHWELEWCVGTDGTTVISDDPLEVQVTISVEDEELLVTLDEDFTVVDTERRTIPADTRQD